MTTTTDPVCGMRLDPSKLAGHTYADTTKLLTDPQVPAATTSYHGADYYFCSTNCRERFNADPDTYASGRG